MNTHFDIPSGFINTLRRYVSTNNLQAPDLEVRMARYCLEPRVPLPVLFTFLQEIHQLHPVPALGLQIGYKANLEDYSAVGHLTSYCSDLGEALQQLEKFRRLLLNDANTGYTWLGDKIRLYRTYNQHYPAIAVEFGFAIITHLVQMVTGSTFKLLKTGLPIPTPHQPEAYEAFLGCPVEFESKSVFIDIPKTLLQTSIRSQDAYLRQALEKQANALMEESVLSSPTQDLFLCELEQYLKEQLPMKNINADSAAKAMGYSLRTFYRKLKKHHYTFRALVADIKLRSATQLLLNPQLNLTDIAHQLGYSDQSAFIRAFKNWTGHTPSEYRSHKHTQH